MGTIIIQGNENGTGSTTLQSGNTNSDFSLTLPETLGTVGQLMSTDGTGGLLFVNSPIPFQDTEALIQVQAIAFSFA